MEHWAWSKMIVAQGVEQVGSQQSAIELGIED